MGKFTDMKVANPLSDTAATSNGSRPSWAGQAFRVAGAVAALALCYRGVYQVPRARAAGPETAADRLTPEAAAGLQEQINQLLRQGKAREALPLAQRILREFPENPSYLRRLAELQDQLGDFNAETELWERFMLVAPSPGESCPMLGEAYRKLGRLDAAVDACRRSVALEPRNSEYLYYLGRSLEWAGQYPEARKTYQKVCALNPGNTDGQLGWARMEVFGGDPAQAARLAGQVLARSPENTDALLVQGMALRQPGRYPEARAALEHGLRVHPNGDLMLVLAGVSASQNRIPEAISWYDKYLAANPGDAEAARQRARLAGPDRKPTP